MACGVDGHSLYGPRRALSPPTVRDRYDACRVERRSLFYSLFISLTNRVRAAREIGYRGSPVCWFMVGFERLDEGPIYDEKSH